MIKYIIHFVLLISLFFYSCANQQPPDGGEPDTTPPKAEKIQPIPGTKNFKGNSVKIKFDEYVDKRSFRDALFISPKPKGELNISWNGREVEIEFSESLQKNTTYVFTIGKNLRDVRAGNTLQEPIIFAISTGDKIDEGEIYGNIYDYSFVNEIVEKYQNVIVIAYKLNNDINPEVDEPNFITQSDNQGKYRFTNLPSGKIRLFCLNDKDKNFKFDKDFDEISLLNEDITIEDTSKIRDANFLMNLSPNYFTKVMLPFISKEDKIKGISASLFKNFLTTLATDSLEFIYSSLKDNEVNTDINPQLIFYFKNNSLNKIDIIDNIFLSDTNFNNKIPLSFRWLTDSLLEVSPLNSLSFSTYYVLKLDFSNTEKKSIRSIKFQTAEERKIAKVKYDIARRDSVNNVFLFLLNSEIPYQSRYLDLGITNSTGILKLKENSYWVFSFIDEDGNGYYNFGNYYPYVPSEKFFVNQKPYTFKYLWEGNNNIPVMF